MDISILKEKTEDALLSSAKRIVITVLSLVILISIPITYTLVGQRADLRQRAAGTSSVSGTPSCEWSKPSVNPGETAELILINYNADVPDVGGKLAPVISPPSGYRFIEKLENGNFLYQLDTPGSTFTASLLDPESTGSNSDLKTVATCIISTTNAAGTINSQNSAPVNPSAQQDNSKIYDALVACMQEGSSCDPATQKTLDYYPDGVIDAKDLNVYLRNASK